MGTTTKAIVSMAAASVMAWGGTKAKAQVSEQEPFKTQYILGVNFMPEWQIGIDGRRRAGNSPDFSPNVGLSFEARLTRHSGIETGFYYRNVKYAGGISLADPNTRYDASYSRYFSIPVLYKYYSRILNVGAGINYDFRFSQSDNRTSDAQNRFGLMVKVSKNITLSRGLFLEPEFHFNPFVDDGDWNDAWLGFQIGLKYRF